MRAILTLTLALPVIVTACSARSPADDSGKVSVVASFYPLAEAASHVGADAVSVTNLTPPGVEPHDLELTPEDVEAITTADVVLYLGGGFQPAVEQAVESSQGVAVDVLEGLDTAPVPPGESDQGLEMDPHVWLDPDMYGQIVGRIEGALAKADPSSKTSFSANAQAFDGKLATLDSDFRTGLDHCSSNLVVTNHAAFGYLAAAFGLRQEAISGLDPEAEPSPQRIADLKTLVEREGVKVIFTEDLVSPAVAQTLAREAGVRTEVLHTLEADPGGGADYVSEMEQNLRVLRGALGCE